MQRLKARRQQMLYRNIRAMIGCLAALLLSKVEVVALWLPCFARLPAEVLCFAPGSCACDKHSRLIVRVVRQTTSIPE